MPSTSLMPHGRRFLCGGRPALLAVAMSAFSGQDSAAAQDVQPSSPARVVKDIEKSRQDDRLYRGLVLENGLKVLLVSDETTDKAAAALDVNVGHLADPRELPGLAHFCEHMLFMGTEKYPDENEYSRFLSQHGGSSNAYTSGEHTNYYFDVAPAHLAGALDRFSQFFLCPLFTPSATDREVKAVNSEHEKNIPSDAWRLMQLEHSLSDPEHDYSKFGTGNKVTLDEIPKSKGIDVREALLDFHRRWYSANIMGLTVLGKESLDELEAMVREKFSDVENKGVKVKVYDRHPFRKEDNKTVTYAVPVKDIRNLNIHFAISDLHPYYRTGPGHYLGHLIGHEGPGSLLSELKARGWASSLVGGQKSGANGFGFFVVNLDLSPEGMKHVDDIVSLVFQYLRMLRETGPLSWVFEECSNINAMLFRFKDKERPQGYVCNLASNLHDFPLEEVLTGGYLLTEWKPELVEMVLNELTPENFRMAVIAQDFEEIATESEKWYGAKYKVESVPEAKLRGWTEAKVHENLKVPERNEFIPTQFDQVPRESELTKVGPQVVRDTPLSRVWFKQDNEFRLPKATLNLELMSPFAYLDPYHANLTSLFVQLFKDDLNEFAYAAELAGLNYSLSNTKYGVNLSVRGYNEKQHVLLEKIVAKMMDFKANKERFPVIKEAYARGLKNFKMEQPYHHAVYYNSVILSQRIWEKEELVEALEAITAEDVEAFVPRLLSSLHLESLVHGNMTESQALALVDVVEKALISRGVRPLTKSQLCKDREVQLADNTESVFKTTNAVHKSSSIETYLQCGVRSTRDNMLLELLAQIVQEPCFNVLRTQEQLGYIVFSGCRRSCGTQGFRVIVQSDRHPDYLDSRIESFLESMETHIVDMDPAEFERHKQALADKRLEKPKKLSTKSQEYWSEISSRQFNFDRDAIEVEELRSIDKEALLAFFRKHICGKSEARKKLSCHVVSMAEDGAGLADRSVDEKVNIKAEEIKNMAEFRSHLCLYPTMKPYVDPKELTKN